MSGYFLERTDKVTISNTSVSHMINYILKKIKKTNNKKGTYRKIDNSSSS
jgi:hypothetical protein